MIPFFIVIMFKNGMLGVLVTLLLVWGFIFYAYANYLHHKKIINNKISYPLAILMVITSFFY